MLPQLPLKPSQDKYKPKATYNFTQCIMQTEGSSHRYDVIRPQAEMTEKVTLHPGQDSSIVMTGWFSLGENEYASIMHQYMLTNRAGFTSCP